MYCPKCGLESSDEAVYCRSCGLSLPGVAAIVSGAPSDPLRGLRSQEGIMRLGFGLFLLGLVIALLNAAFSKLLEFPDVYGKTVFLVFIAMGLLVLGAGLFFPSRRSSAPGKRRRRVLTGADPTAPLLSVPAAEEMRVDVTRDLEPVSSVTEHTTRNLG
jgi:hypothetical protein